MLHIDIPSRTDIERLASARAPHCLSLYLPTSPDPLMIEHDRLVLKNLGREGLDQLRDVDADPAVVAAMEESIQDLLVDDEFWRYQASSLAVFMDGEHVLTYRLPDELQPAVEVADRFHLKPLLRAVTVPRAAFVLALAQKSVRLVEVSADLRAYPVDVPGMPREAASPGGESAIGDRSRSSRLQSAEGQKMRMRQHARNVDRAVREVLAGRETPLILASTAPMDSIYRSVNTYPFLADEVIKGNPERTSDEELAAAAHGVLDRLHEADMRELHLLFAKRDDQDRATTDVAEAARAATFGAVAILLIDIDDVVPGTVGEDDGRVEFAESAGAGSYGIVDETARRALATGARVLGVRRDEIPGGGSLAAILRYPL